ncbi:MAG: hypothetical protein HIU86_02270 [Acidobacteria bacterium]|nr:hypothetical protein [Acidobacteriota bacterium]
MRRISYAETVLGTDERLGDLLLEYAALLARTSSADTVILPCRVGAGEVEAVSILVGPASQIAAWSDDEPFGVDVSAAVADLERRIAVAGGTPRTAPGSIGPGALDDFDELA